MTTTPNKIQDLEDGYIDMLNEKIPILFTEIDRVRLLDIVLEYVFACESKDPNKIENILFILAKINKFLQILLHIFNNIQLNITRKGVLITSNLINNYKNEDPFFLKYQSVNAESLLEAIMSLTVYYYCFVNNFNNLVPNITANPVNNVKFEYDRQIKKYKKTKITSEKNNNIKYFVQKMTRIKGYTFLGFLKYLEEKDYSLKKYERIVFTILRKIAEVLNKLQNSCNFIHGDLHLNNVMIKFEFELLNTELIDFEFLIIELIDFEYSVIQLPFKSTFKKVLLLEPVKQNLERINSFDFIDYMFLKCSDLNHLFNQLIMTSSSRTRIYKYNSFIDKFINTYKKDIVYCKIKNFLTSNFNKVIKDNNIFYPQNFLTLSFNNNKN